MSNVMMVTGNPAFTKSRNLTSTPCANAFSTTMTLAAAPKMVAFPASVELDARASQSVLLPATITGDRSITAGTLLIRFDSTAEI